jgi:two-component sensor histidine kinase
VKQITDRIRSDDRRALSEGDRWNIPELRSLLDQVFSKGASIADFRLDRDFNGSGRRILLGERSSGASRKRRSDFDEIGHCVMVLNARRVDNLRLILLVIEDVTKDRLAAKQQKMLLGEARHRVKNLLMTARALSRLTVQSSSSIETLSESFGARPGCDGTDSGSARMRTRSVRPAA